MYYPYFRGKQFELIAIRETASLLAKSGFIPIIEPVKETLNGLGRALKSICDANGNAIVIVNPNYGDHAEDGAGISQLLKNEFIGKNGIAAGILLKDGMDLAASLDYYRNHKEHEPVLIHAGFTEAKALSENLAGELNDTRHVFFEKYCGKLYCKHFKGSNRVLLRDGFIKRRNADYPPVEVFSELHITYDEDMNGFGDFLIVGDDYSEGGGPAYAVAIHLTYIDPDDDNVMYINHFVSETKDTPTDPAGKFSQALSQLIAKLNSDDSKFFESTAIKEFKVLHNKGHFPGLGHVKKLSMNHHIETLADFFSH